MKEVRFRLTEAERTVLSRQIVERLKTAADWSKVQTVHYFEPLKELLEPDISGFIIWLEDNYPETRLFAPKLIGGEWHMISINENEPPTEFEVVIVPMLGFDDRLHRIGYGGGYYDKFLATQPNAQKIGVCFETGKLGQPIPKESHDIPLNAVITEKQTYKK